MASREQDKPSAELLRRSLATAARAEDACPEPEILAAYTERTLAADEIARYELHFSSCPRCREQLAAMARAGELAGAAEKDRAPAPRVAWFWDWRWLAPAVAAVVIVAVFVVRRPSQRQAAEEASHDLVAMSQPTEPPPPAPQYAPATKLSSPSSEIAAPAKPPAIEKKEDLKTSGELPSRARENAALDKLSSPPAAQKTAPLDRAEDTSVAAAARQPVAAPPAPPPPAIVEPVLQGTTDSTTAVAGASGVAPESVRSKQVPAPALMSRAVTPNELVVVETAADRIAQTLVRSPDPQVLWRISSGRVVERSSDAGATWREQWTSPSARIVAGAAPSAGTCWLVGRGGIVLLTTDGKTWKTIAPPAAADFVSVSADSAASATVTASDGRQFTTSDGGKRWTPAP